MLLGSVSNTATSCDVQLQWWSTDKPFKMSTYDGKFEFYRTLSSDKVRPSISQILEHRDFSTSTFLTVKFVFHNDTFIIILSLII